MKYDTMYIYLDGKLGRRSSKAKINTKHNTENSWTEIEVISKNKLDLKYI